MTIPAPSTPSRSATTRPSHNGEKVTAHDFKWSIERAASPELASHLADTYLNDIIGAEDYIEGNAESIEGVQVIDERTLQITIDAPKAYFLAKLSYPTAFVLHQETVESGGRNWWVDNAVGTGPFMLDEYRIGERIVLKRFDDYYREPRPDVGRDQHEPRRWPGHGHVRER